MRQTDKTRNAHRFLHFCVIRVLAVISGIVIISVIFFGAGSIGLLTRRG
jgi:hypothetical protein